MMYQTLNFSENLCHFGDYLAWRLSKEVIYRCLFHRALSRESLNASLLYSQYFLFNYKTVQQWVTKISVLASHILIRVDRIFFYEVI